MADEPAPTSIADRIAALKLSQVGKIPGPPPPSYGHATNGNSQQSNGNHPSRPRPPPPPRPQLPARPSRPASTNIPPTQDFPATNRPIANNPEQHVASVDGNRRPALPARTSTQSSQSPALPPRRTSGAPAPSLPPRRPSEAPSQTEYERSRRGSTDSMSSIATTRSSISGISNATSLTSQGDRYGVNRVKAPEYDPSALPPLPPKRTKEERETHDRKYAGLRPLRQTKSTPKVEQIVGKESTAPPIARQYIPPPALPGRRSEPQEQQRLAIEPAKPTRTEPAPPPRPRQSALAWGMNKETVPPLPGVRPDTSQSNGAPPPIPSNSKPDLAALQASKPKINGTVSAPARPIEITSPDHLTQVISTNRGLTIVDFYADYCGPCKNISPTYDELCLEFSRPNHIAFAKVNRPAREDCYSIYGVEAMPTILYFKDGREVDRMVGASPDWLKHKVDENLQGVSYSPQTSQQAHQAPVVNGSQSGSCLHCRDFSGPDNHAARFPRESLPYTDVGWLAQQLTAPFPSHTDKARAIFTWLHHNVAYDTVAFFNNNIKPSTPQSTLQSGLAVCEGYAGLFAAIAVKAGLEAIVVSGDGKGFGYSPLAPGAPIPPFSSNHAWNAVKIDNGQWKLLDACWGAGTVHGANQPYVKRFAPERFTQSNNDFGLDHFPGDRSHQFRTDDRVISWEEYSTGNKNGCGADFFSGFVAEEGLLNTTFQPTSGKIILSQQGPTVRFAFQKVCPHWDPVRCGKGPYYMYVLHLEGLDGTQRNHIPFETNGEVWWCDVPVQDLGRSGQVAQIYTVTTFGGNDGRGLTIQEYRSRKGRVGMSFGGVCKWQVV